MYDQIITYLRQNPEGTSSRQLAEMFLKFKSPNESLATITVQGILSKDRRAVYSPDKLWRATTNTRAPNAITFDAMPLVSVSVTELLIQGKPRAAYLRLDLQFQKAPSKAPDVQSWRTRQMSSARWRS